MKKTCTPKHGRLHEQNVGGCTNNPLRNVGGCTNKMWAAARTNSENVGGRTNNQVDRFDHVPTSSAVRELWAAARTNRLSLTFKTEGHH